MHRSMIDMVAGCLYFYGAIPAHELYELIQERNSLGLGYLEFVDLVFAQADDDQSPYEFGRLGNILIYNRVDDPAQIMADQQARQAMPYRPVTMEDAEFIVNHQEEMLWTEHEEKLCAWIQDRLGADRADGRIRAVALMIASLDAMRNDSQTTDLVQKIAHEISFNSVEEVQDLNNLLMEIWTITPQWSLKGWSPQEAAEFGQLRLDTAVPPKKIGRNDPCPCGSGRKYKNCCVDKEEN